MIVAELGHERIFEFLASELPADVWDVCKLSDVDRHQLAKEWSYILHMVDIRHAVIPT